MKIKRYSLGLLLYVLVASFSFASYPMHFSYLTRFDHRPNQRVSELENRVDNLEALLVGKNYFKKMAKRNAHLKKKVLEGIHHDQTFQAHQRSFYKKRAAYYGVLNKKEKNTDDLVAEKKLKEEMGCSYQKLKKRKAEIQANVEEMALDTSTDSSYATTEWPIYRLLIEERRAANKFHEENEKKWDELRQFIKKKQAIPWICYGAVTLSGLFFGQNLLFWYYRKKNFPKIYQV